MFLDTHLPNQQPARIIVRTPCKKRLLSTCFRGETIHQAGNLFLYRNTEALFADTYIRREFLAELECAWLERSLGTNSITITHNYHIGFESTVSLKKRNLPESWLESFQLTKNAVALRVRPEYQHLIPAPATRDVTFVFELKDENGVPTAVIHSIYAGTDIGELTGDVSMRENRAFFAWDHPGELLPK